MPALKIVISKNIHNILNTLTFDLEHNHIVNENEINLIELNVTQLYLIQFMGNGNTCTNKVENTYKMHNTDLLLPVNPYMKNEMLNLEQLDFKIEKYHDLVIGMVGLVGGNEMKFANIGKQQMLSFPLENCLFSIK